MSRGHIHNEVLQWIVIAIMAFGGGYIIRADHHRAATDEDIQSERAAAVRRNCEQANSRHSRAVDKTLELLGHPVVPPQRKLTKTQERANREAIIEWVSTLVPQQNCDALVAETVKATGPKEAK